LNITDLEGWRMTIVDQDEEVAAEFFSLTGFLSSYENEVWDITQNLEKNLLRKQRKEDFLP
jgi:hypothetical protein